MDIQQESDLITIICNQTNYNEELAKEKLILFNNNYIAVIKDFLNIPEKKKTIDSLNQEIYKQIRLKLNESTDLINKINYDNLS